MDFKLFILNACVLIWTFRIPCISSANCDTVFPGLPTFQNCAYRCHCKNDAQCDEQTGSCDNGCEFGWMGPGCQYRNVAQFNSKTQNVGGTEIPTDFSRLAVDGDVTTCARTTTAMADSNYRSYWRIDWAKEYRIVGLVVKVRQDEACRDLTFNRPTSQSSTYTDPHTNWAWVSSRAVDGRAHTSDINAGDTCSATNDEIRPYWNVDFLTEYVVHSIYFYGRLDKYGQYSYFEILLIRDNETEPVNLYKEPGNTNYLSYQPKIVELTTIVTGRHLKVERPLSNSLLSICELVAFGECPLGKCGWDCNIDCHCAAEITGTVQKDGKCPNGCSGRWTGVNKTCTLECTSTQWGNQCQNGCGSCYRGEPCNVVTGHCENGCSGPLYRPDCTQECTNNTFGVNCEQTCGHCKDGIQCNMTSGHCQQGCELGWQPPSCLEACTQGRYGHGCTDKCGHCLQGATCNPVTGVCENGCDPWFLHPFCNESVNVLYNLRDNITITMSSVYNGMVPDYATNHWYGTRDPETCKCCSITTYAQISWWKVDLHNTYPLKEIHVYASENDRSSIQLSGFSVYLANDSTEEAELVFSDTSNINEDNDHFVIQLSNRLGRIVTIQRFGTLAVCNVSLIQGECSTGYFGPHCADVCHCADGAPCNRNNGNCQSPVCKLGWAGPACNSECPIHRFGEGCKNECFCKEGSCTKDYGICNGVCQAGYRGAQCNEACPPGTFGESCTQMCHCHNATCSADDGLCPGDCIDGYEGQKCNKKSIGKYNTIAIGIGVGVGAFVLIVILSVVIYRYRIYKREQYIKENYASTDNRNASPEEQVYDSIDTDNGTNEVRQGETNM